MNKLDSVNDMINDPLNYEPTAQMVLVKINYSSEEKKVGGIILPTVNDKNLHMREAGTIMKLGSLAFNYIKDDVERDEDYPAIGDRVYFKKYAGVDVTRDGGYTDDQKNPVFFRIINDVDVIMHQRPEKFRKTEGESND